MNYDGQPVVVEFREKEEYWIAYVDYLNLCCLGDTMDEALECLEADARYFVDYYATLSEDDLVGHAIEMKERFSRVTFS